MTFNPSVSYITSQDGTVFQVLNEDGTDWDEAATAALYEAYLASLPKPAKIIEVTAPEEKGLMGKIKDAMLIKIW